MTVVLRFAIVFALLGAVLVLDILSGPQVRLGVLYAGVVAYGAWHSGKVFGLFIALFSAIASLIAERRGGYVYDHSWIAIANTVSRFAIYAFVGLSFNYFRRTITLFRRRTAALSGELSVCVCCHRVDGGAGFWIDFPTYLQQNNATTPRFAKCPLCEGRGDRTDA